MFDLREGTSRTLRGVVRESVTKGAIVRRTAVLRKGMIKVVIGSGAVELGTKKVDSLNSEGQLSQTTFGLEYTG
jgi:hypothetical protein